MVMVMGRPRLLLPHGLVVGILVLSAANCEAFSDAGQPSELDHEGASMPPVAQSPIIHYHQKDGLNRIDLDDDKADDETFRAFQLARYTGEANEMVAKHEMEFRRKRREEMERGQELGERNSNTESVHNGAPHNDAASEAWNRQHEQQQSKTQKPTVQKNRMEQIMGTGIDHHVEMLQVGEQEASDAYERIMGPSDLGETSSTDAANLENAGTQLPFDAVHVAKSGDIEDQDVHFVMTDNLRHAELKNAVLGKPEKGEEATSLKLAKKMESEQQQIQKFRAKQADKDKSDMQRLDVEEDIGEALERHHLQRDTKGRVVPNF